MLAVGTGCKVCVVFSVRMDTENVYRKWDRHSAVVVIVSWKKQNQQVNQGK